MGKVLKTIFLTFLFILGITFSIENNEPLVLKYYFGLTTPPIPVFLLVMFSVLLGVLLAGVAFLFDEWTFKRAARQKERQVAALEREIESYKSEERRGAGPGIG
jgi:uncharacterized integral membrane protein